MKFKDLNPPVVELPSSFAPHRIQLIRPRASSLRMHGLSMPPIGLMHGRFCLPEEPVAYLADSPETALYESLLRRETVSRSLSELRRRCLVAFVTTGSLRLADLRGLAEPYPVLQSLRITQTQELAVECRAMALDGVVYASAQHPQRYCVALFHSGIGRLSKRGSQRLVKTGTNRLLHLRMQVPLRADHSEQSEAQLREGAAAHIEQASTHWMRHTAGSHQSNQVDLKVVRDNLGHANISTTNTYLHAEDDTRHDATSQAHKAGWSVR